MKKKKKILIGAGILTTVVASGITLALVLPKKDETQYELSPEEAMNEIYDVLNTLPGSENSIYDDFNHFHEEVIKSVEENDEAITDVILDIVDEHVKKIKIDINENTDVGKLIQTSLESYMNDVDDMIKELKAGFVGIHDFNYYKELLATKVDNVYLNGELENIRNNISNNKIQIDETKKNITEVKDSFDDLKKNIIDNSTLMNNFKDDIDTKFLSFQDYINAAITDIKNANASAIRDVKVLQDDILSRKTEIDNNAIEIKKLYDELEAFISNGYSSNDKIDEKINQLNQKINELEDHKISLDEKTDTIMTDLQVYVTNSYQTILDLSQADKELQDEIDKLLNFDSEILVSHRELKKKYNILATQVSEVNNKANAISGEVVENFERLSQMYVINQTNINLMNSKLDDILNQWTITLKIIDDNSDEITKQASLISNNEKELARILTIIDRMTTQLSEHEIKIYKLEERIEKINRSIGTNVIYEAKNEEKTRSGNDWLMIPDMDNYSHLIMTFMNPENNESMITTILPIHRLNPNGDIETFVEAIQKDKDKTKVIYIQLKQENEFGKIRVLENITESRTAWYWYHDRPYLKLYSIFAAR